MSLPKLPGSKGLFLPILQAMGPGEDRHASDLITPVQQSLDLSEEQITATRPGHSQPLIFQKLVATISHLVKAGLLQRSRRGYTRITQLGQDLLATNPSEVSYTTLREFAGYKPNKTKSKSPRPAPQRTRTFGPPAAPAPTVRSTVSRLNDALVGSLASELRQATAQELNRIVCELLEKLGYGTVQSGARANGGADGAVLVDPLGLNHAYVKTASGTQPVLNDLQIFASAIESTQTDVGIFVAAQGFSSQARGYALGSPKQMVLLGSDELARLMVEYSIGVLEYESHTVKELDERYFPAKEVEAS